MNTAELLHLYDYNYWANARILDTAARADPAVLSRPTGLPYDSVLGVLAHLLAGEHIWRVRCQEGLSPKSLLSVKDFPDLHSLRVRWGAEEKAMRAYLAGLSDASLTGAMRYRSTDGRENSTPLWQVLLHLVNHGTQHRAEAAAELTRAGQSPGDIDYMVYIRTVPEFDPARPRLVAPSLPSRPTGSQSPTQIRGVEDRSQRLVNSPQAAFSAATVADVPERAPNGTGKRKPRWRFPLSEELLMMVARGVRLPFVIALGIGGYVFFAERYSGWVFYTFYWAVIPFLLATLWIEVRTFTSSVSAWRRRKRSLAS